MGFDGWDDIIKQATQNGNILDVWFQKQTVNANSLSVGGLELFTSTGCPAAGSWSGANGTSVSMDKTTTGAMYLNSSVSPGSRYLLNSSMYTTATAMSRTGDGSNGHVVLFDFLLYYPGLDSLTAATTITNSVSLPRYVDAKGVKFLLFAQTAGQANAGQTTLTFTFTADDNTSRTTQMAIGNTTYEKGTLFRHNSSGGGSWYGDLTNSTFGVKSLTSYTIGNLAASGANSLVAVLAKPLAYFNLGNPNIPFLTQTEYLNQQMGLPIIQDNACLALVMAPGTTMPIQSNLTGKLGYIWNS